MSEDFKIYLSILIYMSENNINNKEIILSQLLQKDKFNVMKTCLIDENGIRKDEVKFMIDSMEKIVYKLYIKPQKYSGNITDETLRKILLDHKYITLNVIDSADEKTNDELDYIIAKANENSYAYAEITKKKVYLKLECIKRPSNIDLFAILHEIGHIETNTSDMWKVQQEYLATQWALDHCDTYGVIVDDKLLKQQQKYIYSFLTNDKYKNKYILKYNKKG